ncbi:MAG: glycosyltransferase [Winogradskyella sp.]|uniref:glycosyltransferase n=1 Tax=Winogradskyella sp. TaxID=1883156 RepID=UPI0025F7C839|nr:glycosyltransferase [Winogradskyella sp.]NRB82823.1 glycosyltransferase [Winogradskyella sp.]
MIATSLIIIIVFYLFTIAVLVIGFDKVKDFNLRDLQSKNKFTVIIPFRNEAENLRELLSSIYRLNYPITHFEIILVNDESQDNSIEIINTFIPKSNLKNSASITVIDNLRRTNSPKKDAISSAIKKAKYDWIITTDADCVLPKYWLDAFDEFIQSNNPICIVAPVRYQNPNTFLDRFQTLDFLSLQGATIGGFGIKEPFLANGANFGYKRCVFLEINGFTGNENIASGDDIFLLEKFKKLNIKEVSYLKSDLATVTTKPVCNFESLIQQRLRWASKTSHNPNWFSKFLGLIVFLGNFACILMFLLMLFQILNVRTAVALLVIKFGVDFLLLFKTSRFFKQESVLLSFLSSSILYPLFSVAVVLLSFFNSFEWKDRGFKK